MESSTSMDEDIWNWLEFEWFKILWIGKLTEGEGRICKEDFGLNKFDNRLIKSNIYEL